MNSPTVITFTLIGGGSFFEVCSGHKCKSNQLKKIFVV